MPRLKRNDTHKRYTRKQHCPEITSEMQSQTDAGCEKYIMPMYKTTRFSGCGDAETTIPVVNRRKTLRKINNGWTAKLRTYWFDGSGHSIQTLKTAKRQNGELCPKTAAGSRKRIIGYGTASRTFLPQPQHCQRARQNQCMSRH